MITLPITTSSRRVYFTEEATDKEAKDIKDMFDDEGYLLESDLNDPARYIVVRGTQRELLKLDLISPTLSKIKVVKPL